VVVDVNSDIIRMLLVIVFLILLRMDAQQGKQEMLPVSVFLFLGLVRQGRQGTLLEIVFQLHQTADAHRGKEKMLLVCVFQLQQMADAHRVRQKIVPVCASLQDHQEGVRPAQEGVLCHILCMVVAPLQYLNFVNQAQEQAWHRTLFMDVVIPENSLAQTVADLMYTLESVMNWV